MCVASPLVMAGSVMELGEIRQATPDRPHQYVIPVGVVADGYSTFSATIVSPTMATIKKWETIERKGGVDVVVTTTRPIQTPQQIMLMAEYQGRDAAGHYQLQPVVSAREPVRPVPVPAIAIPLATAPTAVPLEREDAPVAEVPVCPRLVVRTGSLMANVERLTGACGYVYGEWRIGDREYLHDFRVETDHQVENADGVQGLLSLLASDYGLSGVIRQDGNRQIIDYYEFRGD